MKPWTENLILHSIFKAEVQLWPFLRMRNSKLGKQPMRRRGPFATTSRTKGTLPCTTLLIKWLRLQWRSRDGFVGSNSHMSTDRPKAASRRTIRPNARTVYAKCYNQCCACKTAEMRKDTAHQGKKLTGGRG